MIPEVELSFSAGLSIFYQTFGNFEFGIIKFKQTD